MGKKIMTGTIIALLATGIISLYFVYAGELANMRNRIGNHRWQTAIFFVSIILIFALQKGEKIHRFFALIILLIDLYLLGNLFFKNNIGMDNRQFLILFGLFMLGLAITYISHRIRYILMGVVGVGIVFVLSSGILPMYENIPNINDFIQSQKSKIMNEGAEEGIITIKNALGDKEIPISEIKSSDIDLSQKTQISFASKTISATEKIFIDIGNGTFINLNPQSAISLEQSGNTTIMQIIQGNIEYYVPEELSGTLRLIGKYKGKTIQELKDTIWSDLTDQFEQKKEDFFIHQLGGTMILNPTVNKIIKFFINTLYSISPKNYQNNLTNYNNIQAYLGISTGSDNQDFTGENIRSMFDDFMSQIKKGVDMTQIKQRIQ